MTDKAMEAARPQLYLDCDGVLADFDAAFETRFGHPPRDYEKTHGPNVFWRNIREDAPDFYRSLPLMAGARELYEAVAHLRPIILTGCPLGGWAEMQKIEWAREHFPGTPLVPCMSKDKRNFCRPGDALVDDYLKYRDLWEGAGGVFIHHTEVAASIEAIAAWSRRAPAILPEADGVVERLRNHIMVPISLRPLHDEAADLITTQAAELAELREQVKAKDEALDLVRGLISEGAMTGFNCHDGNWADRLYASQSATHRARALGRAGE